MTSASSGAVPVIVAQIGARRHYAVPRALHEAGLLAGLYTDFYVGNKPVLRRALSVLARISGNRRILRALDRNCPEIPGHLVRSFDLMGLKINLLVAHTGKMELSKKYARYGNQFGLAVARRGFQQARSIYGFNSASLEIFRAAKAQGLRAVLDQTLAPVAFMAAQLSQERSLWPGWQPEQAPDLFSELDVRDRAEWELADRIVCGSQYVADAIGASGGPAEKCVVLPSAFRTADPNTPPAVRSDVGQRPIRILYAGGVELRKGAPYLLEALRQFRSGEVEARFVGPVLLNRAKLSAYDHVAQFVGPVPRFAMAGHYAWADLIVLPSLCEGSAMVTHEAQAHGVPAICTAAAGASIIEGVTGLTIAPRSPEAIVAAVRDMRQRMLEPGFRSAFASQMQGGFARYSAALARIFTQDLAAAPAASPTN